MGDNSWPNFDSDHMRDKLRAPASLRPGVPDQDDLDEGLGDPTESTRGPDGRYTGRAAYEESGQSWGRVTWGAWSRRHPIRLALASWLLGKDGWDALERWMQRPRVVLPDLTDIDSQEYQHGLEAAIRDGFEQDYLDEQGTSDRTVRPS